MNPADRQEGSFLSSTVHRAAVRATGSRACSSSWRRIRAQRWCAIVCGAVLLLTMTATRGLAGGCQCGKTWPHLFCRNHSLAYTPGPGDIVDADTGGLWYWMRSPEQERRVVMNLFNRYCIRCHGVDGRGVWDIPDVPDFTNLTWQATRPDAYRTRVILEGRGAVMPAFRGTLTLEEAAAMARYLHTFVPATHVSRPDMSTPASAPAPASRPSTPVPPPVRRTVPLPPAAPPPTSSPFNR
jgi:mono/diheme cytochrome c family protein